MTAAHRIEVTFASADPQLAESLRATSRSLVTSGQRSTASASRDASEQLVLSGCGTARR